MFTLVMRQRQRLENSVKTIMKNCAQEEEFNVEQKERRATQEKKDHRR